MCYVGKSIYTSLAYGINEHDGILLPQHAIFRDAYKVLFLPSSAV
jgi:hypothetical protein